MPLSRSRSNSARSCSGDTSAAARAGAAKTSVISPCTRTRSRSWDNTTEIYTLSLHDALSISQTIAIALLILGYELGQFRFLGELALWIVMVFALGSGVDYFFKFSRSVLRPGSQQ